MSCTSTRIAPHLRPMSRPRGVCVYVCSVRLTFATRRAAETSTRTGLRSSTSIGTYCFASRRAASLRCPCGAHAGTRRIKMTISCDLTGASRQASRPRGYEPAGVRGSVSTGASSFPAREPCRCVRAVWRRGAHRCVSCFDARRTAGRPVRRPDCTLATVDHNIP